MPDRASAQLDAAATSRLRPRRWYEANVARGINPARSWEYSVSASLMVVLIAMLAGVSELVARFVVAIFITLFLLSNSFAVNTWLQYRGRGRWADAAFAERCWSMSRAPVFVVGFYGCMHAACRCIVALIFTSLERNGLMQGISDGAVLTKAMSSLEVAEAAVKEVEATIAPERDVLAQVKAAVADARATVEHAIAHNPEGGRRGWFAAWLWQNDQTPTSAGFALGFLVAAVAVAVFVPKHAVFQPGTGFLVFAGFYVVAQAIERLIELLALSPIPPNVDSDAETEAEKKASEKRVTAQKTLVFATLSVLIAAGASVLFGLYFLAAVGVDAPTRWLDVLVTALLISGGTKTLHDLIEKVTATKEAARAKT